VHSISKIYELTIAEENLTMDDHRIQQMLQGVDIYKGEEPAKAASITIHHHLPTTAAAPDNLQEQEQEESPHKRKGCLSETTEGDDDREVKRRKEEEDGNGDHQRSDHQRAIESEDGSKQTQEKKTKVSKKQRRMLARGVTTKLSLEIREGRNRVIRRMCAHVRLPLLHLHRVRIGNIDLDDVGLTGRLGTRPFTLHSRQSHSPHTPHTHARFTDASPLGEWRFVNEDRIEELWQMVGGRDEAVTHQQVMALASRLRRAREDSIAVKQEETTSADGDADQLQCSDASAGLARLEAWFARHRLTSFIEP
jgi:hypothetical protein